MLASVYGIVVAFSYEWYHADELLGTLYWKWILES